MIVAHLIGGNEVKGIRYGVVFINGEKLNASYYDLSQVCGNISLGDSLGSFVDSVKDVSYGKYGDEFVADNHLLAEVAYSTYEVDFSTNTLVLKIDTYE